MGVAAEALPAVARKAAEIATAATADVATDRTTSVCRRGGRVDRSMKRGTDVTSALLSPTPGVGLAVR
jgi:hypothetical protein